MYKYKGKHTKIEMDNLSTIFRIILLFAILVSVLVSAAYVVYSVKHNNINEKKYYHYSYKNTRKIDSDSIEDDKERITLADNYIKSLDYAIYEKIDNFSNESVVALAQLLYGECNYCSLKQKAGVVWVVLNRLDSGRFHYNTIVGIIKAEGQFEGYNPNNPITEENLNIVIDVLNRWQIEKTSMGSVGRVLPSDYYFFRSNGEGENVFRQECNSKTIWDWSWGDVYP